MLWYKSWLETRSRFLIGLVLLMMTAIGSIYFYPQIQKLMPLVPKADPTSELGRRILDGVALAREYRGYIWSQWYRQNLPELWTIFAVLLASGSPLAHGAKGSFFTLSLPVSRARVLGVRAATGLIELLALTAIPALLLPLLSPLVGESYRLVDVAMHTVCLFVAGATFYSLALLLSSVFDDIWRPLLIALGVAAILGLCESVIREIQPYGIFRVMNGEVYFRTGSLPWVGLVTTATLSAAMFYGAAVNTARRDF